MKTVHRQFIQEIKENSIRKLYVFPVQVTKAVNNTYPKIPEVKRGIEIFEISGRNETESETPPRRIKRLGSDESDRSPDSQKIVFYPKRDMKTPKVKKKRRVLIVPQNHRMTSRMTIPRPFNHVLMSGQKFKTLQNAQSTLGTYYQNFPKSMNQFAYSNTHPTRLSSNPTRLNTLQASSFNPVKLSGKFRHPRKNGELTSIFQADATQKPTGFHSDAINDPFQNFKPKSPYEVNQLLFQNNVRPMKGLTPTQTSYFRRHNRHENMILPHYNNMFSRDPNLGFPSSVNPIKSFLPDHSELSKNKPLSLMLDVFPLTGEVMGTNQVKHEIATQQSPKLSRLKPFQGYYQDPSYFNSMQFPQLMPRYPSYYRYMQPVSHSSNLNPISVMKPPSQLVVHLNLYPKNKDSFKRSSTEEDFRYTRKEPQVTTASTTTESTAPIPFNINFNMNTNGHPENINHQFNLPKESPFHHNTTIEPSMSPYYFYDDTEEDDKSILVSPSLIYPNIYRDRPIQLMLQNSTTSSSTTTEKPTKKFQNHKRDYQTIVRPKNSEN
ncbi:CLUMA_CG001396, isoform A [Clunio marinus]|uniref:CLUMA_CG001396, isoform A n=1 Tax=Clunio marinus TaxID=568069 RepID=A0A1J1HHT7_9DIPT|nr:CLUMA_CG001396, isoform A [Clunio marinus]